MEKNRLALTSFLIALGMTVLKVVVGWLAGSLAILSEATHTGVDTLAVLFTYLAVRVSEKPADTEHPYGHGKIESLAALLQVLVLLLVCFFLLREAVARIVFKEAQIRADWWAFAVMGLSIVVDWSRSRLLLRAARKYSSQALEADAYHFSVDMYSSALVIAGLAMVRWAEGTGLPRLGRMADAATAIAIVGVTLWVSLRLGRRALDVLMDRAPAGAAELVRREVERIPGVREAHKVRVRRSGSTLFVDLHVQVARNLSSERSHELAELVERKVEEILPRSETLVHVDPVATAEEDLHERIRLVARNHAMTIHHLHLYQENNRLNADLHLEVSSKLDLHAAHQEASRLENWIRREIPEVSTVHIHLEDRGSEVQEGEDVTARQPALLAAVREEAGRFPEILDTCEVRCRCIGGSLCVFLHCAFAREAAIGRVHEISSRIEERLKARFPLLARVVLQARPMDSGAPPHASPQPGRTDSF